MKKAVIYIHGKGGNAEEAAHYVSLFPDSDVIGFDYISETPWDAKDEFSHYFDALIRKYDTVRIIANSIGAFFAMNAEISDKIKKAFFISPIVDMEKLISDMMIWENVTESELRDKREIKTSFGETLSWDYLMYVRKHPVKWDVPTYILYGENDTLTSFETIASFSEKTGAALDVMKHGEHWFHTEEQLLFLNEWINRSR